MVKVSCFTPTHGDSKYLPELWETIKKQTYENWEWIIVKNNGGVIPFQDSRIRVLEIDNPEKSIGKVKRFACDNAKGEILVEIDHDDLITPDCLEEIVKAFENPEISFAYSNFAEFYFDDPRFKDWESNRYSEYYGWKYRPFEWQGHSLWECLDFEPNPSSFAMIWWAPNHIRAWRAEHYRAVGGHSPDLQAVDDFDLEIRTYLYGKFKHIDKCLYLYRMHGDNQWIQKNQFIQEKAKQVADENFYKIVYRWAELENLKTVNIEDIGGDLNKKWNLKNNSVGIIKAWDRLQTIKDPIHAMNEIYRVLAPGGWLLSSTVSTDGRGAWQDPRNKSYWNENTFYYFSNRNDAKFLENDTVRFQAIRHRTYFPNQSCQERNIPYVLFDGIALKDNMPYRLPGAINI